MYYQPCEKGLVEGEESGRVPEVILVSDIEISTIYAAAATTLREGRVCKRTAAGVSFVFQETSFCVKV